MDSTTVSTQEDIFNKKLWDIPSSFESTKWHSGTGAIATMTKTSIHVHTPQFKYMAMYKVCWVTIERFSNAKFGENEAIVIDEDVAGALTKDDKKTPLKTKSSLKSTAIGGSLASWIKENAIKEGNVYFRSIEWIDSIASTVQGCPALMVLLSDGSMVILDIYRSLPGHKTQGLYPLAGLSCLRYGDQSIIGSPGLESQSQSQSAGDATLGLNLFGISVRCDLTSL
jgi:hypothetical protein